MRSITELRLEPVYRVLRILKERGELVQSEILALTGRSSTFHQKYLRYLIEKGYLIEREERIQGKRFKIYKLSDKGEKLLELLEELKKLDES